MKKYFYLLLLASLTLGSYAQDRDAKTLVSDYISKVGIGKHKDQTLRLEMEMDIQGNTVPMTIYYAKNQTDMRIDMVMMNNDMSLVIVGNQGWIESGDQCQDLPADFIAQTRHTTFFTTIADMSGWTFSSVEKVPYNEKEYYKIKGQKGNENYTLWIDAATNLMDYVDVVEQGISVRICFSDYKQFADMLCPSVISTVGIPQMTSAIKISAVSFGIEFPEWYFERP